MLGWYRRRAQRGGWADGQSGSVTVIQRFGLGLQLNVHGHALVLDGVFTDAADSTLRFHPAAPPTDMEVARLVATIRTRVLHLLRRRWVFAEPENDDASDPLGETSLALAGITSAAVQGRSALGPRAGARVLQVGHIPGAPWVTATGSRQAHLDGFDLHANVAIAANNREGLEQLARYVLRPPIAQERLTRTADGRVLLTLKAEWSERHQPPVVRPDRVAGTPRSAHAAPAHQPHPAPRCVGAAQSMAGPGARLWARQPRPTRPRSCRRMRPGSSAPPAERAGVRRRAGGE